MSSSEPPPGVEHWLGLLRDGSEEERQRARTELGLLLEERGMLAEAADAYRANVEAGAADRRPYERLAVIARQQDDPATEAWALRALADLLDPPAPDSELEITVEPTVPAPAEREPAEPEPPPCLPEPPLLAADEVRPPIRPAASRPSQPQPTSNAGGQAALIVGLVVVSFLIGAIGGPLLPIPFFQPAVLAPTQTRVIAALPPPALSVAASPSPSPFELMIAEAATPVPIAAAPSPASSPVALPARCTDAAVRFPATRDTEAAVRGAYSQYLTRQGISADAVTATLADLGEAYASRHAEIVAGWMAVTLQRERRGLAVFSLADYVASDVVVAVGPGQYQMRATISPQGWAEIQSWPADTCEGAFIRDPANARWVDLMRASVGDITWALSTPTSR